MRPCWPSCCDTSLRAEGFVVQSHREQLHSSSFEWVLGGKLMGSTKNLLKDIAFVFPYFSQFVKCFTGDDSYIYFWEDFWVGEKPLCSSFPHLYHLLNMKLQSVASVLPSLDVSSPLSLGFLALLRTGNCQRFLPFTFSYEGCLYSTRQQRFLHLVSLSISGFLFQFVVRSSDYSLTSP